MPDPDARNGLLRLADGREDADLRSYCAHGVDVLDQRLGRLSDVVRRPCGHLAGLVDGRQSRGTVGRVHPAGVPSAARQGGRERDSEGQLTRSSVVSADRRSGLLEGLACTLFARRGINLVELDELQVRVNGIVACATAHPRCNGIEEITGEAIGEDLGRVDVQCARPLLFKEQQAAELKAVKVLDGSHGTP